MFGGIWRSLGGVFGENLVGLRKDMRTFRICRGQLEGFQGKNMEGIIEYKNIVN